MSIESSGAPQSIPDHEQITALARTDQLRAGLFESMTDHLLHPDDPMRISDMNLSKMNYYRGVELQLDSIASSYESTEQKTAKTEKLFHEEGQAAVSHMNRVLGHDIFNINPSEDETVRQRLLESFEVYQYDTEGVLAKALVNVFKVQFDKNVTDMLEHVRQTSRPDFIASINAHDTKRVDFDRLARKAHIASSVGILLGAGLISVVKHLNSHR